jgi:hypothetical protein
LSGLPFKRRYLNAGYRSHTPPTSEAFEVTVM